jgi:hypothetical protein
MNCEIVRRRLLGGERPDQPPSEVRLHLAGCPRCLAYQRRLVGVERLIPRLPVPPSATARAALLQHVLAGPAPGAPRPAQPPPLPPPVRPTLPFRPPPRARAREGGRQKLALASALVAALVVFAVGLWAWPSHDRVAPHDPLAHFRQQRDERLLHARTPEEQVEALARYAEHLVAQARTHPADARRLALTAQFFDDLVRRDLLDRARAVPAQQRARVLGRVAERLGRSESEASHLAADLQQKHSPSAPSLLAMAESARAAEQQVRALARGEAV